MDDELHALFTAEVSTSLQVVAQHLEFSAASWDVERLFRLVHGIKGAAGVVGATTVLQAAHVVVELLDALRGTRDLSAEQCELVLRGVSLVSTVFDSPEAAHDSELEAYGKACAAVRAKTGWRHEDARAQALATTASLGERVREQAKVLQADSPLLVPRSFETCRVSLMRLDRLSHLVASLDDRLRAMHQQHALAQELANDAVARGMRTSRASADQLQSNVGANAQRLSDLLASNLEEEARLVAELQEATLALCMVPFGSIDSSLSQILDECKRRSGRLVHLRVQGGHVEIHHALLEHIRAPLAYVLRDAVVHGTQIQASREPAEPASHADLTLCARVVGSWLHIDITSAGGGPDLSRIREVTRNRFRAKVQAIGGRVEGYVDPSAGPAIRFRIPRVPLVECHLRVRIGNDQFLLPMAGDSVRVAVSELSWAKDQWLVDTGEALLPVLPLERLLGRAMTKEPVAQCVLVVRDSTRVTAIGVDEVLGTEDACLEPVRSSRTGGPLVVGCTLEGKEGLVGVLSVAALFATDSVRAQDRKTIESGKENPKRVLIVAESPATRTQLCEILSSVGCDVLVAADSREARSLLDVERVDLLVGDAALVRPNELELTEILRATAGINHVPVIFVSSLAEAVDRRGADLGADACVMKGSLLKEDLLRAVDRLLFDVDGLGARTHS